jgi:O-antigen/teichoic acid export membrane protein
MPVFLTWIDRIVVGIVRPAEEMGVYHAVSQFSILFSIVLSGIGGGILGPMMARMHSEGEQSRLLELFRVTTKWGMYASIPAFLVMCMMPMTLLVLVYGSDYAAGTTPLIILACAGLVNASTGPVGVLLVMTGKEKTWLAISVVALALDVLLLLIMTPRWGISGAAMGRTVATTVMFAAGIAAAVRELGLWPYDRRFLKGLAATAIAAISLLLVKAIGIQHELIEIILGITVAVGVFGMVLWRIGIDPEDRDLVVWVQRRMGLNYGSGVQS